jgi:hypothetical protein
MSIAGISSNFTAASTAGVQAEANQYAEDEQLLTQTLQTQILQNTTAETASTLTSLQPLTTALTALSPTAGGTDEGALLSTLAGESVTAAPGQASGFGIVAEDDDASGTGSNSATTSNNASQNSSQGNAQPGPLQALVQEIQASAQQAYGASQGYGVASEAANPLGNVFA